MMDFIDICKGINWSSKIRKSYKKLRKSADENERKTNFEKLLSRSERLVPQKLGLLDDIDTEKISHFLENLIIILNDEHTKLIEVIPNFDDRFSPIFEKYVEVLTVQSRCKNNASEFIKQLSKLVDRLPCHPNQNTSKSQRMKKLLTQLLKKHQEIVKLNRSSSSDTSEEFNTPCKNPDQIENEDLSINTTSNEANDNSTIVEIENANNVDHPDKPNDISNATNNSEVAEPVNSTTESAEVTEIMFSSIPKDSSSTSAGKISKNVTFQTEEIIIDEEKEVFTTPTSEKNESVVIETPSKEKESRKQKVPQLLGAFKVTDMDSDSCDKQRKSCRRNVFEKVQISSSLPEFRSDSSLPRKRINKHFINPSEKYKCTSFSRSQKLKTKLKKPTWNVLEISSEGSNASTSPIILDNSEESVIICYDVCDVSKAEVVCLEEKKSEHCSPETKDPIEVNDVPESDKNAIVENEQPCHSPETCKEDMLELNSTCVTSSVNEMPISHPLVSCSSEVEPVTPEPPDSAKSPDIEELPKASNKIPTSENTFTDVKESDSSTQDESNAAIDKSLYVPGSGGKSLGERSSRLDTIVKLLKNRVESTEKMISSPESSKTSVIELQESIQGNIMGCEASNSDVEIMEEMKSVTYWERDEASSSEGGVVCYDTDSEEKLSGIFAVSPEKQPNSTMNIDQSTKLENHFEFIHENEKRKKNEIRCEKENVSPKNKAETTILRRSSRRASKSTKEYPLLGTIAWSEIHKFLPQCWIKILEEHVLMHNKDRQLDTIKDNESSLYPMILCQCPGRMTTRGQKRRSEPSTNRLSISKREKTLFS